MSKDYGPWAVITGASDGIGRAIAGRAASAGINVVLAARSQDRLEELAADLARTHRVDARTVAVDLSRPEGPATLIAATQDLDVGLAVLAAGFGGARSFVESSPAEEHEMIAVNVGAVAQLAQFYVSRMVARGRGGIMLFGSVLGWQGVPGQANYSATKAYVQALGEGLHGELKPRGVDVLCVAPGPVHTGFAARAGMTLPIATTPNVVAEAAWGALGKRVTVVPGVQAKAMTAGLKTLPRYVRSVILGRVMASMRNESHGS